MKINEIEKAVLLQHLKNIGVDLNNEARVFDGIRAIDRWYSGVGFITELAENANLKVGKCHETHIGGEVGAMLNSTIDSGYLFYVKNGYLESIEGYTYTDPWPDKISKMDVYKLELG